MNENRQCFKFSCPDYILRYRMSKDAEKKMEEVKILIQDGNFSKVANPKPFAQELQFPSSSANYANFESRKSVFKDIMAALQDSNVKMIGVHGTGGVGKTTMVEEIGKQVKNGRFDEVVVAVVSQDANVSNIQGQLADRLNLELKGETEVGKANKLWNRLNNGKKNLIILDDMWQELNLKTIGIPITDGNNCCKVVITSRIRGVLEKMHVDRCVPMEVLLEKEAWALFKMKVGNSVDSPELHDVADAVCKECGGLPVTILAVGAALKDKKEYVWEDVLDQFKDSMLKNIAGIDPKVYASLKLSYDQLESSDAKSCFLLCCFFPEDTNISIEVLARHCIARSLLGQNTNTLRRASRRVLTVVDILKDACLLLEGEDENFVKMHDVIRDVALSIAKDDGKEILVKHGVKEWPEKDTCESYSAISLRFDNTLELPDDLVCPQLHTLSMLLKREWRSYALLNVPDRFFSGMEKLTILELNRICMLPPLSLANLVNLRMLWLDDCELGDIAILKDLNNNLEILSLRGSNIEVLPSEIGQLTRLRLLDLGNCKKLREIPQGVISNLSRLEELYILDDLKPWEVTRGNKERSKVNLDELGKLTQLTTLQIHIPNVMLLPKDFCFENLIRFKIEMGKEFDFSGNYSFRTYSKSCKLAGVSLMDKLIVLLMRAEQLHLQKLEGLQEVLHDRGAPSGFFNNLIELTVRDCRLKYLFSLSCARGFPRLQRLRIFDCEMMEAIVGIEEEKDEDELSSPVINFSQLKYLRLENLPKLISFYPKVQKMSTSEGNSSTQAQFLFNEKVAFPVLEDLEILELPNIIEIWEKQLVMASEKESKSFYQLKYMNVSNCEKLVHVVQFNMLSRLQNLEAFYVDRCPKMEAIVSKKGKEEGTTSNDIIVFSQLTTLYLSELVSLKSFYNWPTRSEVQPLFNHKVAFPVLENLKIQKLPNIIEIWDEQLLIASEKESKSFCQLKDMKVSNCEKLVHVGQFNMLPRLQNLKKFNVDNCPRMEAIVSEKEKEEGTTRNDIIVFSQLTTLNLSELVSLKSFCNGPTRFEAQPLFNHQVAFPVLENLKIQKLPNIIEIWDEQLLIASEKESKSFCQLKDMKVSNCEKLVHVGQFNMLPRLQNLKKFNVDNCRRKEAIVSEKEKEEGTTRNDIIVFSQLTTLNLSELVSLKSFCNGPTRSEAQPLFNHKVAFPVLEDLEIQKLPNIIEIWDKQLLIASEKESKSFCQLKDMKVCNCEKLVHVVQFNMLPRLQNLKKFNVDNCPRMEAIVSEKEKEEGTTRNDIIVFSQLTTLNLSKLVSLRSFYNWPTRSEVQPLFNHKVAFPVLEYLEIQKLPNIIEIWDKQLLIASEKESKSFCQLKDMKVSNCEKFVHVVQFNMLPRLQNLKKFNVDNCPRIEAIVSEKEKEEGTPSNDIIVFSQLTTLNLSKLVSLKSFYNWPTRSEAQPLFNHQVSFPKLETLFLDNCVNSREIHPWNVQAGKISLKFLDIANLDKLIVRNCSEVAEVFQLEGLNVGEGQHVRPLIEVRMMELDGLPQLTCLWNKDPHGILGLQSLQYLTIKKCSLLRNLFTCSTAMALQQLKVLYLESCPVMEEVIAATEDGLKEVIDDVIEFPKLEWLILKDLPNLNSFCNAKYNFNLPSLQRVVLKRCPNMHDFTFGQVRMSQIFVSTHGNDGLQIEDLNKYLKEQLLLKGEECTTVDENDHLSHEVKFSYLDWQLDKKTRAILLGFRNHNSIERNMDEHQNAAPPKAQFFGWLAWKGKVKTTGLLHNIGVIRCSEDTMYPFCKSEVEMGSHVLIHYPQVWKMWSTLLDWWGISWVTPANVEGLLNWWMGMKFRKLELQRYYLLPCCGLFGTSRIYMYLMNIYQTLLKLRSL
ncbi:hypothetical protein ACSBR2_012093 [Camellia fascicularis]